MGVPGQFFPVLRMILVSVSDGPQRPVLAFMLLGPVVRGVGSTGLLASGGVGCTSMAGTCSPCYVSQPGRDLGVLAKSFETFLSGWYLRFSGAICHKSRIGPYSDSPSASCRMSAWGVFQLGLIFRRATPPTEADRWVKRAANPDSSVFWRLNDGRWRGVARTSRRPFWCWASLATPANEGSFDISRDAGAYVGFGVEEPLQADAVHHGGE